MLSSAELASMRATTGLALPDVATVKRKATTTDEYGETSQDYSTVATLPCRVGVATPQGNETVENSQTTVIAQYTLTFNHDADVRSADRVIVGTRTFEAIEPFNHSWIVGLQVACVELS